MCLCDVVKISFEFPNNQILDEIFFNYCVMHRINDRVIGDINCVKILSIIDEIVYVKLCRSEVSF